MESGAGKGLFAKLQEIVDCYNKEHGEEGGKAVLQWYNAGKCTSSAEQMIMNMCCHPRKREGRMQRIILKLILAVCTPIMSQAHQYVQQSKDIHHVL